MLNNLTVFVIETGEPSLDECLSKLKKQTVSGFHTKIISNVCPMWRAFQSMLDMCETEYFVQVDADMLLHVNAIETLYERITKQPSNTAISVAWLWDVDINRQIQGVKIYKHSICVDFPYSDSLSCEINQVKRMKRLGFDVDVMDMPEHQDGCAGIHHPSQSPEMAFRRWERSMLKMRRLPWMKWLSVYPSRILKQFMDAPNDPIKRSKLFGLISGLSQASIDESEADYSIKNEAFDNYSQFFSELELNPATTHQATHHSNVLSFSSHASRPISNVLESFHIILNQRAPETNDLIWLFARAIRDDLYLTMSTFYFEIN